MNDFIDYDAGTIDADDRKAYESKKPLTLAFTIPPNTDQRIVNLIKGRIEKMTEELTGIPSLVSIL